MGPWKIRFHAHFHTQAMLTTRYQKVASLTVTDVLRMHALFEAHYASSPLATFLDDLSRKEGAFIVRRRSDGEIVGFSTLGVYQFELGGARPRACSAATPSSRARTGARAPCRRLLPGSCSSRP